MKRRFPLSLDAVLPAKSRPGGLLRPQQPLADAARAGARAPQGLGLDSSAVRERLVARLEAEGLRDPRVLAALRSVPRHLFVDSALAQQAYEDTALPIGWGQTISKPSVIGRMLALLLARQPLGARLRLLEVGTGCGYQAALLMHIAQQVVSIERLKPLHDAARSRLLAPPGRLLRLVHGDGRLGDRAHGPYDGIIAAAAGGEQLPPPWLEQLAPGGRLVAPLLDRASGQQRLAVVDREADGSFVRQHFETVLFVPLESGVA